MMEPMQRDSMNCEPSINRQDLRSSGSNLQSRLNVPDIKKRDMNHFIIWSQLSSPKLRNKTLDA